MWEFVGAQGKESNRLIMGVDLTVGRLWMYEVRETTTLIHKLNHILDISQIGQKIQVHKCRISRRRLTGTFSSLRYVVLLGNNLNHLVYFQWVSQASIIITTQI